MQIKSHVLIYISVQAFLLAWKVACEVESAVFFVPAGYSFMIQSIEFNVPYNDGMTFQVKTNVTS